MLLMAYMHAIQFDLNYNYLTSMKILNYFNIINFKILVKIIVN